MARQDYAVLAAGLGFEDCSARMIPVKEDSFAASGSFVSEHVKIAPKSWDFYSFNVTDDDYQIVANIAGENDGEVSCEPHESCAQHEDYFAAQTMDRREYA